jgi:hypothetical protein
VSTSVAYETSAPDSSRKWASGSSYSQKFGVLGSYGRSNETLVHTPLHDAPVGPL